MVSATIDVEDPVFDEFMLPSAIHEFRPYALPSNTMQLMGLFTGM